MRMVLGSLVTPLMEQIERGTVVLQDFPIVFIVRRRNDITELVEP